MAFQTTNATEYIDLCLGQAVRFGAHTANLLQGWNGLQLGGTLHPDAAAELVVHLSEEAAEVDTIVTLVEEGELLVVELEGGGTDHQRQSEALDTFVRLGNRISGLLHQGTLPLGDLFVGCEAEDDGAVAVAAVAVGLLLFIKGFDGLDAAEFIATVTLEDDVVTGDEGVVGAGLELAAVVTRDGSLELRLAVV